MRWALVAVIFVVACGSVFAADEKETRQQKIDRLCSEQKWEEAEPYVVAEIAAKESDLACLRSVDARRSLATSLCQYAVILNSQSKWQDSLRQTELAKETCGNGSSASFIVPWRDEVYFHISTQEGIAQLGLRNNAEAEKAFEHALLVADRAHHDSLNANHVKTAATLVHLANAHLAQGKSKLAKPHLQRALVIFEEQLGKDAPQTTAVREMLAELSQQMRPKAVMAE